mgnify:CR=1 FL=1
MHFLIDADLPRSLKPLIERYGHDATDVRDVGLGGAKDPAIAAYAQSHNLSLMTGDFGFAELKSSLSPFLVPDLRLLRGSRRQGAHCLRKGAFL